MRPSRWARSRAFRTGLGVVLSLGVVEVASGQWSPQSDFGPPGDEVVFFGSAAAVSGEVALVSGGSFSGPAYLHHAVSGELLHRLNPLDPSDSQWFGVSVALDESTALVGGISAVGPGSAYLFDTQTGEEQHRLTADVPGLDLFGSSVALEANTAVVAAYNPFVGDPTGSVHVFDVASGAHRYRLDTPSTDDVFGSSVALSEGRLLVGAPGAERVLVFDVVTGDQTGVLLPNDPSTAQNFGGFVEVDGDYALVSYACDLPDPFGGGCVDVYDLRTGSFVSRLEPDDAESNLRFASSMAISGEIALVGASGDAAEGVTGRVYAFDVLTGELLGKYAPPNVDPMDRFGTSVALDGQLAVIGAEREGFYGRVHTILIPEPSVAMFFGAATACVARRRRRQCRASNQIGDLHLRPLSE